MPETASIIQELEQRQQMLLASLCPFYPYREEHIPSGLQSLDRELIERLVQGTGFQEAPAGACPQTLRFIVETLKSTDHGRKLVLQSDIELLDKLHREGIDQEHRSAFGTHEGLLPVFVNGDIVWSVWTGKLHVEPMSDEFISFLSEMTTIPFEILKKKTADIPVHSEHEIKSVMQDARKLRDILQAALEAEVRNVRLTQQLVKSERLRSLGTLSSGVAHHFNNLLSVILGYSSFVTNREELSEKAAQALRQISEAAQKGRRLTEEILAFSGSEEEESINSDVHEALLNVLSLLQSQISSRIQITKQLTAARHFIQAPPSVVHQIVFNILTNSIDSMPDGGSLTVVSSNRVLGGEQTEYLSLRLTDTGNGFPSELNPLTTADELTNQTSDRDVLKLSSVYGMVERLEGTVTVAPSAAGENTVEVLLPVASPAPETKSEKNVSQRMTSGTIWVLDDDPIFRKMCKQVLSDDGHDIAEFTSGSEFMDHWIAAETQPDLLILDFSMPEYNGLEIRQWLDKKQADLAVVLVSGFGANQPNIKKALASRKTFFLQKPFSVPELADIVAMALGETLIGG